MIPARAGWWGMSQNNGRKVYTKGMSFIITLYVREGMVMASDSRLSLNRTRPEEGKRVLETAICQSDAVYKTCLAQGRIGISTYGAADVQGVPIAGFIESFLNEHLPENCPVDEVPAKLLGYFRSLAGPPDTGFLVAGYKANGRAMEQHLWEVTVAANECCRVNAPGNHGASWRGVTDVLARLIQPVGVQAEGKFEPYPSYSIEWGYFTLQDAIDYAIFAVKVTIDEMRFHTRAETVGGPIDVLVIKPHEAFWVQHKELHGQH